MEAVLKLVELDELEGVLVMVKVENFPVAASWVNEIAEVVDVAVPVPLAIFVVVMLEVVLDVVPEVVLGLVTVVVRVTL